jgi:hypothetical protein
VRKRREELKHAQDVREMYEEKLRRATNMYSELNACLVELDDRERDIIVREQAIRAVLIDYGIIRGRTRHRFARPMVVKAGPKLMRGCVDGANDRSLE